MRKAKQWLAQTETHAIRLNLPLILPETSNPIGWVTQRPRIETNMTGEKSQWNVV